MADIAHELVSAFNRHPNMAYSPGPNEVLHEKTPNGETVTITLQAQHVKALTRIVNAAPLNGDPFERRVYISEYTDLPSVTEQKLHRFIHDNNMEYNLDSVITGFFELNTCVDSMKITLPGGKYHAVRIDSITQSANDGKATTFVYLAEPTFGGGELLSCYGTNPEKVEGDETVSGEGRAIRYYPPTKYSPLGGILMERTY